MFDKVKRVPTGVRKRVTRGIGKLKSKKGKNLAVFVDGPNILRKELNIDLREIKSIVSQHGKVKIAKVFLNQYASNKLIEAVANEGFESVITVGDVDVAMAVDATEAIFNPSVQCIVFVTRDADFLPAVLKTKAYGKETIALLAEEASSVALKNAVDRVIILNKK